MRDTFFVAIIACDRQEILFLLMPAPLTVYPILPAKRYMTQVI